MEIISEYKGDLRFQSGEGQGCVTMDAPKAGGGLGEAPSPKTMLLYGLAGCTGLDVVAILKKKKVEFENFTMKISADQTSTHPKVFKSINMEYHFKANSDDRKHIERAIVLSTGQFCGVSHMLKQSASIEWKLIIE